MIVIEQRKYLFILLVGISLIFFPLKKKPNSNNTNKIVFVLVNNPNHTFLCISINEETVVEYFYIAKWKPFFTELRNNAITKLQIVPKVALLLHTTEQ